MQLTSYRSDIYMITLSRCPPSGVVTVKLRSHGICTNFKLNLLSISNFEYYISFGFVECLNLNDKFIKIDIKRVIWLAMTKLVIHEDFSFIRQSAPFSTVLPLLANMMLG